MSSMGLHLTFLKPREELALYIRTIWVCESEHGLPLNDQSIAAPNGCAKLVIQFENSIFSMVDGHQRVVPQGGLYFVGNRDSSVVLQSSQQRTRFIVIEFYPHG